MSNNSRGMSWSYDTWWNLGVVRGMWRRKSCWEDKKRREVERGEVGRRRGKEKRRWRGKVRRGEEKRRRGKKSIKERDRKDVESNSKQRKEMIEYYISYTLNHMIQYYNTSHNII